MWDHMHENPLHERINDPEEASQNPPESSLQEQSERRTENRLPIQASVRATIFADGSPEKEDGTGQAKLRIVREGLTKDLSVHGASVSLKASLSTFPLQRLVDQTVKLRLDVGHKECPHIDALGQISWVREEQGLPVLGVRFIEIPEKDRVVLERFSLDKEGEQNLIYKLWEIMVSR